MQRIFLVVLTLFLVSTVLTGCEKKVPTVGNESDTVPTTETRVQTERKKSDNESVTPQESDTAADHVHEADSYEIDREHHQYVCNICNVKVKSVHMFPGGVEPCIKCQAKRYIYPGSGYTVIKSYDAYGNVTEEKLYDAEGKMAYDRGYKYTYEEGIMVGRTDYENNILVCSHIYTYNWNGTRTDTLLDVDGVVVSETID